MAVVLAALAGDLITAELFKSPDSGRLPHQKLRQQEQRFKWNFTRRHLAKLANVSEW
jgi:hypothetical protein